MSHRLRRAIFSVGLMEVDFLLPLLAPQGVGRRNSLSYSLRLSLESQAWASELFLLWESFK